MEKLESDWEACLDFASIVDEEGQRRFCDAIDHKSGWFALCKLSKDMWMLKHKVSGFVIAAFHSVKAAQSAVDALLDLKIWHMEEMPVGDASRAWRIIQRFGGLPVRDSRT